MSNAFIRITRTILITAVFAAPSIASDDALPKGEQILDQYLEATGGRAAYEKLHNRVAKGTLEFVGMGIKFEMSTYGAEPQKQYVLMESDSLGKMEQGTDGTVVWENSSMMGPQIKVDEERAFTLREATFNAPLHWKELYKSAECVAAEEVDGKSCYKVVMTPNEGQPKTNYYDKSSHLLVRSEFNLKTTMGTWPFIVLLADYKSVDGVLLAHKVTQEIGTIQKQEIVFESIEHNTDIPADRFDIPAEIQALLDKDK